MKQPPMICALSVIQPWAHCIAHKGKVIAKRNAKVVAHSKFVTEFQKTTGDSVWVTNDASIIEYALQVPGFFELQERLRKKAYLLILENSNKSWEVTLDSLFKKSFVFSQETSLPITEIFEVWRIRGLSR